jgi:hypothetical protein
MKRSLALLAAVGFAVALAPAAPADAAGSSLPAPHVDAVTVTPSADEIASDCPHADTTASREVRVSSARAAAPVGTGSCADVRPGARVTIEGHGQCTLNFRFSGRDRNGGVHHYIGTAGHCVLGDGPTDSDGGERTWRAGQGPLVLDAAGNRIGRFAYAVLKGKRDFGLIRIAPGVRNGPTMCHFGGPTGVNRDQTSATTRLQYYGQGLGTGATVPARTAVAQGMPSPNHVHATGLVMFGDSGAPVLSADGRAVGLVVTTGVHTGPANTSGVDSGTIGVTRIAPVATRAASVLGQRLTLHRGVR